MITKTKDAELIHVKTLAFKIVKYLLDGIIDGEIKESDLDSYREAFVKSGKSEEQLFCKVCEKTFKSKTGFKLHKTRVHRKDEQNKCKKCNFFFQGREYLAGHIENCKKYTEQTKPIFNTTNIKCDYCDLLISSESEVQTQQELKKHHELCQALPKK